MAAYRKANPTGKVKFAPLYIESTACAFAFGANAIALAFHLISILLHRRPNAIEALIALAPGVLIFHALRRNNMARSKLISDMEHFDISSVQCTEEFDKEFVLTAIRRWYGSLDAFTAYVRGPLRDEMMATISQASMPFSHCWLIASSSCCQSLTAFLSLWKCGAPHDVYLGYFVSTVLAQSVGFMFVFIKLSLFLCDRFATPCRRGFCNALQSCVIYIAWLVCFTLSDMVSRIVYRRGMVFSLSYLFLGLLVFFLTFQPCRLPSTCRRRRRLQS